MHPPVPDLSVCECLMTQFGLLSVLGWELQFANLMAVHFVVRRWVSLDAMVCLARQAKGRLYRIIRLITLNIAPCWCEQGALDSRQEPSGLHGADGNRLDGGHYDPMVIRKVCSWYGTPCVDTFFQSHKWQCVGRGICICRGGEGEEILAP